MGISAAVGVIADYAATVSVSSIVEGAAIGGLVSAATGGNPLTGALTGGLGAFAAPAIGSAFSDVMGGAAGGAGTSIPIDFSSAAAPGITSLGTDLAGGGINLFSPGLASTASSALGAAAGPAISSMMTPAGYGAEMPSIANVPGGMPTGGIPSTGITPSPSAAAPLRDISKTSPIGTAEKIGETGIPSIPTGTAAPITMPSNLPPSIGGTSLPSAGAGGYDAGASAASTTTQVVPDAVDISSTGDISAPVSSQFDLSKGSIQSQGVDLSKGTAKIPTPSADTAAGIGKVAPTASTDWTKTIKDTLMKAGPQLGLGLISKAMQPSLPGAAPALQNISKNAATTQALGTQLVQASQSGQVTAAQQAGIDQWATQAKAKIKDYYARAGLSDSSMMQSAMAEIDNQAMASKQSIIQNNLTQGLAALGASDTASTQVANASLAQDANLQKSLGNFGSSIGSVLGGGQTQSTPQTV